MTEVVGPRSVEAGELDRAAAFDAIVQQHLDASYRTAALILRDHAEAEDATHDALVIAWRRWSSLRDPSKFAPWFGRILTNVCVDRLRRRRRTSLTDVSAALEARQAFGDNASAVADRDMLARAFTKLSPEHRVVIVLRYFQDLPVEEIAQRVGVPAGTIKSRLHHALRDLGIVIGPQPGEPRR
jgi:RNA polymerase sigma-70 factor (ECF subfamily)